MKHIYQQNKELKHLVKEDSILVNKEFFAGDLERGIDSIREEFRTRHKISSNGTVIFLAPGNEEVEAEFTMENARRGIKEFLLKYSAPTSLSPKALPLNNFTTVISVHSGSDGEAYVRKYLNENEWYGRLIVVN